MFSHFSFGTVATLKAALQFQISSDCVKKKNLLHLLQQQYCNVSFCPKQSEKCFIIKLLNLKDNCSAD